MEAKFITFEGGEGAGKSTQAAALAQRLEARGINVLVTREPGGSPFAEKLREFLLSRQTPPHDALAETLLFYAARSDHLVRTIRPALAAGRWVICDRFSDSTRVYQGAAGGVDDHKITALEDMVVDATQPDLTIILDLPAKIGMARAAARHRSVAGGGDGGSSSSSSDASVRDGGAMETLDIFEARHIDFHDKLRVGFLQLAKANPQRCGVIDARADVEIIAREVWKLVVTRLADSAGKFVGEAL